MSVEHRSWGLDTVSIRARPGVGLGFRGRAALYNKRTWIGPPRSGFYEEIVPGAFARNVETDDVRFLVDHDPSKVLARTASGTLRLTEDKKGLVVDADMADVTYARDLATLLERGDLGEMSFAFTVDDNDPAQVDWTRTKEGAEVRRILAFEQLYDVSCVAYPAYDGTEAALRAVEARRADHRTNQLATLRTRLEAAWKGETHE